MTTQALPSFDQALADQVQHTKNAMDLVKQLENLVNEQRDTIDRLYNEALVNVRLIGTLAGERDEARATIAALERRLAEAQQGLTAGG